MSGTRSIESRQLYRAVPDAVTELGPEEDDLGRESRCGAVALGRTYLLPPLSFGGALLVRPWPRFHTPLIEPDRQISRIRLVWGFLCQGGVTPIWSSFAFHSFVRPAPRALFRPDRIFPSPSRRSGGQGGAFFSAAEGLSLTDASTAAGCRRSGGWPCDDPRGACHWPRSIARTTLVFG